MKCLVDECQMVTIDAFCPTHRGEEAYECDACGEVKHTRGGSDYQIGTVWAGAIDPPDYIWVCAECEARREDAEIDRAEARIDNYGEYPPGYDGR
ncbi:MAG: hypothetical protein M3094_02695 [Actinomycetia bacterium]|nr:hypothetical protein [Actinomycetes bacterium]